MYLMFFIICLILAPIQPSQPASSSINPTVAATSNTPVITIAPSTPGPTPSFTFNNQNKPPAFGFGSSVKPTTSTPNHSTTAAPTAASTSAGQVTGTSLFSSFMPQSQATNISIAAQSTPLKPVVSILSFKFEMIFKYANEKC